MILKGERRNWLLTNNRKEENKNRRTKMVSIATLEKGTIKVKEDIGMNTDPRIDIMAVTINHLENNRLEEEKIGNKKISKIGRRKSIMMDLLSLQPI